MANKFYITTPIYYVNAPAHIGHSYTSVAADALARFWRRRLGNGNVRFLTGTDEHGQKIQKAASDAGLSAQEFTDKVSLTFKDLWKTLNVSYDDFIRTTEERHIKTVERVLEILHGKGLIYPAKYEGLYCLPCELFWPQTQAQDLLCPDCRRPLEKISETNYFFKLSAYQEWLIDYIEKHPFFVLPQIRRNEVMSFLKSNQLTDLCISRPKERLSWGIPLPFSPEHVTYVWFDALINYISAVGQFDKDGKFISEWWQDDVDVVHLVGKDILRQHAIYWPIMLEALKVRPPSTVFAHGWWLIQDTKMSKSRGNVVDPRTMAAEFGIDTYRYFLLREVPFGMDGSFSREAMIKRSNGDLANDLGNLVYRTLTMIEKYFHGAVPAKGKLNEQGVKIDARIAALSQELDGLLSVDGQFNFNLALEKIWEPINMANKYVEETKPWNLAKENRIAELEAFMRLLADVVRATALQIAPFMPNTAQEIIAQIGSERINKGKPLFPRIENKS